MPQRGEHFWFLVAIHGWKISVLELHKNLVLVFSSPPVFTLSWGKIITIIYLACCQLRVFLLMDASCQAVDSYHPINWFEIWMQFSHYLDNLPCMVFIFQPFLSHSWQCSIVSSDSATFVTCSQLWRWWSQIKQVISAPWRPTTPCCLFPCTKMVKFFPFKGNKSWCSFWDRHRGQIQNKIAKWRQLIILLLVVGAFHFTTQVVRIQ